MTNSNERRLHVGVLGRRQRLDGHGVESPRHPAPRTSSRAAAPVPGRKRHTARASSPRPLLERLPVDYRTALELTDMGELTQARAAAALGISTSGMKSRVQRGRRMLRTEVSRCCRIELDARGALADASLRTDGC